MRPRCCPAIPDRPAAVLAAGLLRDPDAQVRLAALLSLADQPPTDEAGRAVAEVLRAGARCGRPVARRRGHGGGREKRRALLEGPRQAKKNDRSRRRCWPIADHVAEHWARGGSDRGPSARFWRP